MIPLIGFYLNHQNGLFFQARNRQAAIKRYKNVSPVVPGTTLPFHIDNAWYFLENFRKKTFKIVVWVRVMNSLCDIKKERLYLI